MKEQSMTDLTAELRRNLSEASREMRGIGALIVLRELAAMSEEATR